MNRFALLGLASSLLLVSAPAAAVTIDFAGYAPGTLIEGDLTIGDATFSTSSNRLLIGEYSFGLGICASNGRSCSGGTVAMAFANGATGLSIDYAGDTQPDSVILWQGESPVLAFRGFSLPDGDSETVGNIFIRFEGVTLMGLSPSDAGIGFGNISYTSAAAVPEPATWGLMIGGVGMAGGALRRRTVVRATC